MSDNNNNIIRTADICDDNADTVQVCEIAFKDYAKRSCFHGEAVTIETLEDNIVVSRVLERGGKGKVLVIDGHGSRRRALCGGNVAALALKEGWAGVVINGCVRDQHEMWDLDFGVKAIGTTPRRPYRDDTGKDSLNLHFGGVIIKPGDYIYADDDGVIVTPGPVHG